MISEEKMRAILKSQKIRQKRGITFEEINAMMKRVTGKDFFEANPGWKKGGRREDRALRYIKDYEDLLSRTEKKWASYYYHRLEVPGARQIALDRLELLVERIQHKIESATRKEAA